MNTIISMLRGVNVGGHNKVKMGDLRELYASLGLKDPQTLIQSGNVVFRTAEQDSAILAARIADAISRRFGIRPEIILRTLSDFRDVVRRNPFATLHGIDPSKLLVTFLAADPGREARAGIGRIQTGTEILRLDGRELYAYFPDGIGRSKVAPAIGKVLKGSGTGRNWNTVLKLLEISEQFQASHY